MQRFECQVLTGSKRFEYQQLITGAAFWMSTIVNSMASLNIRFYKVQTLSILNSAAEKHAFLW